MSEQVMPQRLLWMDLEMTGLDASKQKIIEVAAVVTDFNLNELGSYQTVIHQPSEVLDAAEEWPKQNMQQLFKESAESETSEQEAIDQILALIKAHETSDPMVLAGNSIHQDRRFIRQWWPQVDERIHYRMFDVSTFKIWIQATMGKQYEKSETHRAMEDVLESIDELRWSLAQLG